MDAEGGAWHDCAAAVDQRQTELTAAPNLQRRVLVGGGDPVPTPVRVAVDMGGIEGWLVLTLDGVERPRRDAAGDGGPGKSQQHQAWGIPGGGLGHRPF